MIPSALSANVLSNGDGARKAVKGARVFNS